MSHDQNDLDKLSDAELRRMIANVVKWLRKNSNTSKENTEKEVGKIRKLIYDKKVEFNKEIEILKKMTNQNDDRNQK